MTTKVHLGDVATIERAGVDPSTVPPHTRYLGLEHIERGGRIIGHELVGNAELSSTKFRFTSDHLLFGKLRPNLGKIARPDFDGVSSTDILPIRPGPWLDRDYLAHYLRQPSMIEYAAMRTTGANLPRLSPATLATFTIPFPPIEEQRRIAAILDQADAIRSKRRQVPAHLDALTQSIFQAMFGPMVGECRWPTAPIGDIASTQLGKMLDAKQQTGSNARPYLRNANVQWFKFDLTDLRTMDFGEADRAKFALEDGDVLLCEGGQPGRCAIWRGHPTEIYFQKALHRIRLGERVEPEYFVRAMRSIVESGGLKDFVSTATIAHLTGEKLRRLPIPLPPIQRQREFAAIVERIGAQRAVVERALAADDELFASLQARAFRGEL